MTQQSHKANIHRAQLEVETVCDYIIRLPKGETESVWHGQRVLKWRGEMEEDERELWTHVVTVALMSCCGELVQSADFANVSVANNYNRASTASTPIGKAIAQPLPLIPNQGTYRYTSGLTIGKSYTRPFRDYMNSFNETRSQWRLTSTPLELRQSSPKLP